MALTKVRHDLIDGAAANVKDFGAKGDGTTDDTAAIQAAIDSLNGGVVYVPIGTYKLTANIRVKQAVTLTSGGYSSNPIYRIGTGWEREQGVIFNIEHGSSFDEDDWNQSALRMYDNSGVYGIAFVYPSQDMTSTTPTSYPPTITVEPTVYGVAVKECIFVNSYVAIDARRDHGYLSISNIAGYPIKYGIRIGSQSDRDEINNVHFQPLIGYRGSCDNTNSLVGWINQNGTAIDLGRNSWTIFDSVFAYGYNTGVNVYYQALDTANNINNAGSSETLKITNCGFDSCYYCITISNNGETSNTFNGITISNTNLVPRDAYNSRDNALAISATAWSGNTQSDISVNGCRFWAGRENLIELTNIRQAKINNNTMFEWGLAGAESYAIVLDNCTHTIISENSLDGQNTSTVKGIKMLANNTYTNIFSNSFLDFNSTVINVVNDNNDKYNISQNTFEAGGTTNPILDSQADTESVFSDNLDSRQTVFVGSVDGSGIMDITPQAGLIKYTGTATVNGLTPGRIGRMVTIRFSNAVTVTDNAGGVGASVLRLASNFTTSSDDTLILISDGTAWYEVSRSVN